MANHKSKIGINKIDINDKEIITSAIEWLHQDQDRLLRHISKKYNIPSHEVSSMLSEALMRLRNDYLEGLFKMEVTVNTKDVVPSSIDDLSLPVISQLEGIITRNYRIEMDALRQVRSWVVQRLDYKSLDYLKAEKRNQKYYTTQSLDEIEGWEEFIPSAYTSEEYTPEDILTISEQAHISSQQVQRIVARSIDILSGREHQVFLLAFFSGASIAEIAERLGITETNVRTTKSRGLKKLKQAFSDETGIALI